jgi:transposase
MSAGKRSDRISLWLQQLKERLGWQKTVVALANKNARILWAVLTRRPPALPSGLNCPRCSSTM